MTGVIRSGVSLLVGSRDTQRRSAIARDRLNGFKRFGVDQDLCIGCHLCHERAPENFDLDPGDLYSRVTKQPADAAAESACLEAAEYCPTGGIHQEPAEPSP
jgi:ferredoxin